MTKTYLSKITIGRALIALVVVCLGGYVLWRGFSGSTTTAKAAPPRPVPVGMATVEKVDFPVYLSGLGTVQGLNTVIVRTRVDGQIDKNLFR